MLVPLRPTGLIRSFKGEYEWLSNFYRRQVVFPVVGLDWTFASNEHAYQAQKARNLEDFNLIRAARTPGEAKRAGRRARLTSEQQAMWDAQKQRIMMEIVLAKFRQHEDLRERLLATGDMMLIEGNHWHDNIWGQCSCVNCAGTVIIPANYHPDLQLQAMYWSTHPGKNYLGQILMATRMVLAA